jgi:preprotein translocase subunit SecF
MADIIGKRNWLLLVTAIYLAVAIAAIIVFGLKPGIEFSSGSILTVKFTANVTQAELKQALVENDYANNIVQQTSTGDYIIRTRDMSGTEKTALETALSAKFGEMKEVEFNAISPMVAVETTRNTVIAVAIALAAMLIYMTWAFRRMPSPILFGVSAVLVLAHDVIFTMGFFAIAGYFFGWEISMMFITGTLALVGYGINNVIVVFDRIRENLMRGVSKDFAVVSNLSIIETLGRCLNSTITTLITVLAVLLFVGASIRDLAVVLLVGLVVGTYSAAFIAPALLVAWEERKVPKIAH